MKQRVEIIYKIIKKSMKIYEKKSMKMYENLEENG